LLLNTYQLVHFKETSTSHSLAIHAYDDYENRKSKTANIGDSETK